MDIEKRRRIYNLRIQGYGYRAISKELKMDISSIKKICKKNNLNGPSEVVRLNYQLMKDDNSVCEYCNRKFEKNKKGRAKRFCSDYCRHKWWSKNQHIKKREAIYKFKCNYCNNEFESYGNKNRKFCSHKCYIRSRFWEVEDGIKSSKNG